MARQIQLFALWIVLAIFLSSCGETIRGAWRDIQRVGEGTRTIFVADG